MIKPTHAKNGHLNMLENRGMMLKVRLEMLRLLSSKEQVGDVPFRYRVGDVQRYRGHVNSTKSLASSWSLILVSQM